jgi:nitrogen fixation protein FixH
MSESITPNTSAQRSFNPWPWGIAALLFTVVAVNLYVWRLASRNAPIVDDASYYQLGVEYQQEIDRRNASAALGWRAHYEWSAEGVSLWLLNREGKAVEGLTGELELKRADTRASDLKAPLSSSRPGVYEAKLKGHLGGLHSYRVTLSQPEQAQGEQSQGEQVWLDVGSVTLEAP